MLDIMLGMLAEMKPAVSTVIDCKEVTHRDLSVIEVRYVQGGTYQAARSYATGSWIARTPLGPTFKEDGILKMDCLQDIAEVTTYDTAADLRRRRWASVDELVQAQNKLDEAALEVVKAYYPILHGMVHKATFSFSPFPTIQICLATGPSYKKLFGTIAVDINGEVYVTSKAAPEVEHFASVMRGTGRLPVYKELRYE